MQPQQPYVSPGPGVYGQPTPPPNYDFITNPVKPPKPSLLPGGGSMASRALLFCGGALVLLVAFVILKNVLSGSGNGPALITVAQDQQSLIHIVTNASSQAGISDAHQNFAITAQLSLTSQQTDLLSYAASNKIKISTKLLSAKTSTATDTQLTNAVTTNNYDAVFQQVMQDQLTSYEAALKQAYKATSGTKGRALLNADFDNLKLLSQQLTASN